MLQDKVYRLSEEVEHALLDNTVHTVDDLEAVQLQEDISNDVLPSIVHDQIHHSKLGKHRRMRKGSRMYPAVPGTGQQLPIGESDMNKSYFKEISVDDASKNFYRI